MKTLALPVWHGWASKEITAHDIEHAAEQIPKAVAAILENFPPRAAPGLRE